MIVALATGAVAVTGVVAFVESEGALEAAAFRQLESLQESRAGELLRTLENVRRDVATLSENEMVVNAIEEFGNGVGEVGTEALERIYITENPHPAGERDKFLRPEEINRYHAAHGRYHPWFRELAHGKGYYDVFLVDRGGTVIYSVYKEPDFATNLETGPWKDSGLAEVYRRVMAGFEQGTVQVTDFAAYAPSNGAPAAFIAAPVFKFGEPHGVLIFQMPVGRFNSIMKESAGLGETGEPISSAPIA